MRVISAVGMGVAIILAVGVKFSDIEDGCGLTERSTTVDISTLTWSVADNPDEGYRERPEDSADGTTLVSKPKEEEEEEEAVQVVCAVGSVEEVISYTTVCISM